MTIGVMFSLFGQAKTRVEHTHRGGGKAMSRKRSPDKDQSLPVQSRLLLYQTEDGQTRVEVRLQDETVWLSQSAMTELFQSSKQNISLHLKTSLKMGSWRKIELSRNT